MSHRIRHWRYNGTANFDSDALRTLSFSPSEDALLYSAEAKDPTVNDTDKDIDQYARFRYAPVFGEGFSGKKRPTLYILRWNHSATSRLTSEESVTLKILLFPSKQTIFLGQAVFTSDIHIVATGYEYMESGRLLGLLWCSNRPAGVWEMQLPNSNSDDPGHELIIVSRLSPETRSAHSPRVSADGKSVLWISNPVGGAHASCSILHSVDLHSGEQKTVVDTIWEPRDADGFPGLYIEMLPSKPFVSLGSKSYIATHSIWGSRSTVLLISIDGKEVKDLTPNDSNMYNWSVLGTDAKNQIVGVRSSPSVPHEVVLGSLDDDGTVSWQVLLKPTLTPESAF